MAKLKKVKAKLSKKKPGRKCKPENKPLDRREKRFVADYLIHLSPERAALTAGYAKSTAHTKVYQWVSNRKIKPHVYKAIQESMDKRAVRTEVTQDRVVQEYAKLGFLDPRRFFDNAGKLKSVVDMDPDVAAALTGMDVVVTRGGDGKSIELTNKLKYADKKGALDSLSRHLGMFNDKIGFGNVGDDGNVIMNVNLISPKSVEDDE